MSSPEFIEQIDWPLLKEQKTILLNLTEHASDHVSSAIYGIVSLIDSIQDYAVDGLGFDEEEVFGF